MSIPMSFLDQEEWSGARGGFPNNCCIKRKFRWKFIIPSISASGLGSLPPEKVSRPSISFKEMQAEHLNETIYFPAKPEFKPIQLTLFDIVKAAENPVFTWLKRAYNPTPAFCANWRPSLEKPGIKVAQCFLVQYDGCGEVVETWVFEHAWPQSVDFFDGDMASSDVVTCDVTLRYDRAYIDGQPAELDYPTDIPSYTCPLTPISFTMLETVSIPEFFVIRD